MDGERQHTAPDPAGFDTGARLRTSREQRRLSQRQLAAAAGVTAAMISMIEQNRTSPSIATLKKILGGLGISLGDFFADGEAAPSKWHFRQAELPEIAPRSAPGDPAAAIRFLQVGRPGQNTIQMLHETYAPGADTGPELYSHDGEEAGLVIAGEILVTVGTETRLLTAGDAYLFSSRIAHRFRNPGPAPCIIVSACTPPTF